MKPDPEQAAEYGLFSVKQARDAGYLRGMTNGS